MRTTTRPTLHDTGTLDCDGRRYTIQTYYPLGTKHPEYRMTYVWERSAVLHGESHVFASDDAFIAWLAHFDEPKQLDLLL